MADKVQHYTLGDRIGTGGTGTVRRARFTGEREEQRKKNTIDTEKQGLKKQAESKQTESKQAESKQTENKQADKKQADKKQSEKTLGKEIFGKETQRKERSAPEKISAPKGELVIKTLQPDIARDPVTRKRLLSSRKQLQSVPQQENLARVLDILEQGDTLHVLMEYAPGKSLESSLGRKSRPMPQETAVQILNQVLRGAVAAHGKGVLHGNLKPSDILLQQTGAETSVKVSGFGVAQHVSNAALLRAAGRSQTLPYLAPEQVRGEVADERTDVYSAGMMLYRMLTGKLPYASSERGAEARIRHAILNEPLPDIAEVMPEISFSPQLLAIVRRALAKERRERIPTMRDFSRLVQKVQAELPSVTLPASTTNIAQKQTAQKQAVATSAVAISAAAPALASAALQFPPPPTPIEQQVSVMEPVRSFAASEPTASIGTSSAPQAIPPQATSTQAVSPQAAPPQAAPPVVEEKEKSFWNILTNPGDITTPAAAGAPTLTKSAAELEVERRMQALRASTAAAAMASAVQDSPAQSIATQSITAQNTASPSVVAQDSVSQESSIQAVSTPSPSTPVSSAPSFAAPSFAAPRPIAPSIPPSSAPIASVQTPLYAPETKKKRSALPWLVVGALALGGGVYYVALKNKLPFGTGISKGSEGASQQALSKEELDQQYDSLANTTPNATTPNASKEAASTAKEEVPNQEIPNQEIPTQETSPQEQSSTSSLPQEAQKQAANTASKATSDKPLQTTQAEKTSGTASELTDAPKTNAPKANTPKAAQNLAAEKKSEEKTVQPSTKKERPQIAALSPKPVTTPSSEGSSTTLRKEKRVGKTQGTSERTPYSTSNDAVSKKEPASTVSKESPKESTKESTKESSSKSGSLSAYNAAQDAEREAARAKIKEKYSTHLSKKQRTAETQKLAVNDTKSDGKTEEKSGGKSVPAALKNLNTQSASKQSTSKQVARTNREDNYTPSQNPVDVTNEIDPSTTALESASRKASGTEPYLILRGHVGTVRSVSFSPDGKLIASGSEDKTVKIWDVATGTILRSIRGHGNSVTSVFFSPDSKFVISSSKDKTVRIWDVETGNAIQRSPGVSCEGSPAAFSPDGSFIATANNRNVNIAKVQK